MRERNILSCLNTAVCAAMGWQNHYSLSWVYILLWNYAYLITKFLTFPILATSYLKETQSKQTFGTSATSCFQ